MLTHHLAEHYFQPKIDLIEHLIQYSQNILLVTAKKGGGKTAFAHFCLTFSRHLRLLNLDFFIRNRNRWLVTCRYKNNGLLFPNRCLLYATRHQIPRRRSSSILSVVRGRRKGIAY